MSMQTAAFRLWSKSPKMIAGKMWSLQILDFDRLQWDFRGLMWISDTNLPSWFTIDFIYRHFIHINWYAQICQ